ncbi:hypothetical protein CYMTET_29819 [Cymbomonas tetramitiformis]|uniref:Exostosin GT47 domain-containing protein n=1 Tax=Cymbomonas tetramitiformis TaxID=36881 RepID=A0AAE0FK90_9CHLO|nr:hypothetical protein CYMTET_29819 [Cymbomonas tetramitiformis]
MRLTKVLLLSLLSLASLARSLRIYVYDDLPEEFAQPLSHHAQTMMHKWFRETEYRTMNGHEADYYYIPHASYAPEGTKQVDRMFQWINSHHPYWEAATLRGHANHIMAFPHDHGPWDGFIDRPDQCPDRGSDDFAKRRHYLPTSPERIVMFLTSYGAINHEGCRPLAFFQRHKDIVVPPYPPRREWGDINRHIKHRSPHRPIHVYFSGASFEQPSPQSDSTCRSHLFTIFSTDEPNLLVNTNLHERVDNEAMMLKSKFCFDPNGFSNGWNQRSIPAIAFGCIPVVTKACSNPFSLMYEEHTAVNWTAFSVIAETPKEFEVLPRTLKATDLKAQEQLMDAGSRVHNRFLFDGPGTALETLFEILERRLTSKS